MANMNPETQALEQANKKLPISTWAYHLIDKQGKETDFNHGLKHLPKSEVWAARAIARMFKNYLTYDKNLEQWYFWNGVVHMPCTGDGLVIKIIKDYYDATVAAIQILETIIKIEDSEKIRKDMNFKLKDYKWFRDSLSKTSGYKSLVANLKTEVDVQDNHYDQDKDYIVFSDGQVIDLSTPGFDLEAPDPKRPVTKHLAVALKDGDTLENKKPVRWLQSLAEWLPGLEDEHEYLQTCAGAALMGQGKAKNIPTLVGISNTGKSTYLRTLEKVFGHYAGSLPAGAIVLKQGTNFDQFKARGKRFLYLEEPYESKTDDSFFKNLAGGGGLVSTQEKNKNAIEWRAQCVLHIGANHVPKIQTKDDAIVNRVNIIKFNHVFVPGAEGTVDSLEDELFNTEGVGILLWILEGAKRYRDQGAIIVPDSVRARGLDNANSDSLPITWLLEVLECGCFHMNEDGPANTWVEPKDAYASFSNWMEKQNEKHSISTIKWKKEINRYLCTPEDKINAKSDGKRYIWKVTKSAKTGTWCEHALDADKFAANGYIKVPVGNSN